MSFGDIAANAAYPPASGMSVIDTKTSTGAATLSFTAIPSSYRVLVLDVYARSNNGVTNDTLNLRFNNDATGYDTWQQINKGGATPTYGTPNANGTSGVCGHMGGNSADATAWGRIQVVVPTYAITTAAHRVWQYRSICCYSTTDVDWWSTIGNGRWRSTAAIDRIDIACANWSSALTSGSSATLYGMG